MKLFFIHASLRTDLLRNYLRFNSVSVVYFCIIFSRLQTKLNLERHLNSPVQGSVLECIF